MYIFGSDISQEAQAPFVNQVQASDPPRAFGFLAVPSLETAQNSRLYALGLVATWPKVLSSHGQLATVKRARLAFCLIEHVIAGLWRRPSTGEENDVSRLAFRAVHWSPEERAFRDLCNGPPVQWSTPLTIAVDFVRPKVPAYLIVFRLILDDLGWRFSSNVSA